MVKHILTTLCPRSCNYCISRNIKIKQVNSRELIALPLLYKGLSKLHDSIMLTGGEPTEADDWATYVIHARSHFQQVFITTQYKELVKWRGCSMWFDAITFSWHDFHANNFFEVNLKIPVYCSILSELYTSSLPSTLKELGYSGLTINEDHFGTEVFDDSKLPKIEGFTYKINRRGNCFKLDTIYIMPDLSIRDSFEEYL